MAYLLDTNIVSAILKKNQCVIKKEEMVRAKITKIYMSAITYYEIKRGLLAVNATRKMINFEKFCEDRPILEIDKRIIPLQAAQIHANLKRRGKPLQDADILIAATAIVHNLILVTNDQHFQRIEGLNLENWLID